MTTLNSRRTSGDENVSRQQAADHRLRAFVVHEHYCPAIGPSAVYTHGDEHPLLSTKFQVTLMAKYTGDTGSLPISTREYHGFLIDTRPRRY